MTDSASADSSRLVCVIDDEEPVRQMICAILNKAGFTTVEARDGREGVAMVEKHRPIVVVTDIVMPEQEGIETIIALKGKYPNMRILGVSGSIAAGKNYLDLARAIGADDCLAKPFRAHQLVEKVSRLAGVGS